MRKFNPTQLKPPRIQKYDQVLSLFSDYSIHHLEIGSGVGWHPIQEAKNHPEVALVAVERTLEKYQSFEGRLAKHELRNLLPIHSDIVPWLWHLPCEVKFDKIWILYPNPEPQNKNQRWINSPFFSHILERLKPQGEIEMATNIEEYAKEIVDVGQSEWGVSFKLSEHTGAPRTHFEKKYLLRGEKCWSLVFKK